MNKHRSTEFTLNKNEIKNMMSRLKDYLESNHIKLQDYPLIYNLPLDYIKKIYNPIEMVRKETVPRIYSYNIQNDTGNGLKNTKKCLIQFIIRLISPNYKNSNDLVMLSKRIFPNFLYEYEYREYFDILFAPIILSYPDRVDFIKRHIFQDIFIEDVAPIININTSIYRTTSKKKKKIKTEKLDIRRPHMDLKSPRHNFEKTTKFKRWNNIKRGDVINNIVNWGKI